MMNSTNNLDGAFSSSDDSDLEILLELSDWDGENNEEDEIRNYQNRVNYMTVLNDSDFTYRFRLNKVAVSELVNLVSPYLRVTSSR